MNRCIFLWVMGIFFPSVGWGQSQTPESTFFREDQLFVGIGYSLIDHPDISFRQSGFSYQLQAGFLTDIPLNAKGQWALAPGFGLQQQRLVSNLSVASDTPITSSLSSQGAHTLRYTSLTVPLELRWRNATPTLYSFWRVHLGLKLSYPLWASNDKASVTEVLTKWPMAYSLVLGHNTWNLFVEYQATPLFKSSLYQQPTPNTRLIQLGLRFYLL